MSEQTLQLLDVIRRRLHTTIRRITLAELAFGAVLTLGLLTTLWALSATVEASFWLPARPRTYLFYALAGLALILIVYFVVLPLLRLAGVLPSHTEEMVARRIGERYPEVSDRLVNLLHLSEGRGSRAPAPLVDRAVHMLGEDVRAVPFEKVEDFGRVRRASRWAAVPVLLLLVFLLAAPGTFLGATQRLFSPGAEFARPMPFSFVVEPGSVELVKGDSLTIRIRTEGSTQPQIVTLQLNNRSEEHIERITLTPDAAGTFRHTLVNVRMPLRYRANADPVTGAWHTVELTERPVLRNLRVTLDFPNYTGMPNRRLAPNVGDVAALPGTRVQLDADLGGVEVRDAFIVFDDGRRDTMSVEEAAATGTFTLMREGRYHIELRSTDGVPNRDPIAYTLQLMRDEPPSIVLLQPNELAQLDESMQAGLRMRLSDDFGFARLRLYYRLAESRFSDPMEAYEAVDLPLETPRQLDQELFYNWLLKQTTALDPVPGDVITYYITVWDNDAVAGYKSAQTPVHRLTLPSLAEQFQDLEKEQDGTQQQLEDMMQETESMREQFEELRDELRRESEVGWEDQRQLERLQERQQQMQQQADEITRQLEQMTETMQRNDLVSDETLQLYEELKRVADEVNSPELQETLRQLQESMQNMDPQMMQEALQNYEFSEDQYRQRLERTLELFKKIRAQQKLEEAARRAEELARQQEQLAEKTEALRQQEQQAEELDKTKAPDDAQRPQEANAEQQTGDPRDEQEGQRAEEQQADDEATNEDQASDEQQNTSEQDPSQQEDGQRSQESQQPNQEAGQQSDSLGMLPQTPAEQREDLARQQDQAKVEMKQLEELVNQLQQQMDELRSGPKQEMQQLQQQMQQQQLPQQMQQNSQQLRQDQLQDAQQGQQQMQQQLQQMMEQMQQMQEGMQGQQKQINMAGLRSALSDVLTLSTQQEDLRLNLQGADADNPQLRTFARRQVELSEGLNVVADTLQKLAKEIPQMRREVQQQAGESLREMNAATESLTDRNSGRASGHQKSSMMHLNELALLLSELLNQMQQQSGMGGMSMQQMMQQMQQMSGQQQQLNEQIQQMLNDMQGNRLSVDQQKRLQQMAQQQEALRRQLDEMSRNRNATGDMLGDLKKITEQMQETIEEMRRRNIDQRTVQRQRQILTRLLDAQKSLREQGKEQKREGQRPGEYQPTDPGELTPREEAEQLRRALLRAIESGYAPDYEELIKRYFDLLQQQQQMNRNGND